MKNLLNNTTKIIHRSSLLSVCLGIALTAASCSKSDDTNPSGGSSVPPAVDTVSTYTGTIELAYLKSQNADPACFMDLSNGRVYKVSEAAANAPTIDMLWGTRVVTPSQKYFVGTSDNYILNGAGVSDDIWQDGDLFAGWSKRNVTMMNDFVGVNFDQVKTRAQLNEYVGDKYGILTYIPFDGLANQISRSYVYDITHNGVKYRGVLKISQADQADGWARYTIKVVKE